MDPAHAWLSTISSPPFIARVFVTSTPPRIWLIVDRNHVAGFESHHFSNEFQPSIVTHMPKVRNWNWVAWSW